MTAQMTEVLDEIRRRNTAELEIEIEGCTYVRKFKPKERLILFGGGNIGQAVSGYAASVGFSVVVVDDRPSFANQTRFPDADEIYCDSFVHAIEKLEIGADDFVAVVTRGHRYDLECLRTVLKGEMPRYLGMMGSKRRVQGVYTILQQEGVSEDVLRQIHMPIGLPIGAATPQEIGISITSELIRCRREREKRRSGSTMMSCTDIDYRLIDFLERDKSPKALLMVYETSGSTPVKSGAVMAVNQGLQIAGTIGGGCSEDLALREAFRLIGTGQKKTIVLDMSNDVAAEEGMACGGVVKVWIADIGITEANKGGL